MCSYGFADLFALAAETHRFEKAYNYHLVAPESDSQTWTERNMADKLDRIQTPMLLYHGTEDKVVPYQQSEQIHKSLKERGIRSELRIFEGEGRGRTGATNVLYTFFFKYFFVNILIKAMGSDNRLMWKKFSTEQLNCSKKQSKTVKQVYGILPKKHLYL